MFTIYNEDCIDVLKRLPDNSIDSLVTDPPAGIDFMSADWDGDKGGRKEWVTWMTDIMKECLRVLKPGAHAIVWSFSRRQHWTMTAIEDAGFEIRDSICHIYSTGFPKNLNISKQMNDIAGTEPTVVGYDKSKARPNRLCKSGGNASGKISDQTDNGATLTKPTSPVAIQWDGWGTALKPSHESWILCRKPLEEKTVAKNVLRHGTGAININASRLTGGRWPANTIFSHSELCTDNNCDDDCPVKELDRQSGITKSCRSKTLHNGYSSEGSATFIEGISSPDNQYDDSGGASRFFYCAKPSRSEKEEGLEGFEVKHVTCRPNSDDANIRHESTSIKEKLHGRIGKNPHPTVKSVILLRYLIKLTTPPNGVVLDVFMGSGSVGVAAIKEKMDFVGIEKEKDYFDISQARISSAQFKINVVEKETTSAMEDSGMVDFT